MTGMHVALAYWMGRTLGEGVLTIGQWKAIVHNALGRDVLLRNMTEEEATAVMAEARLTRGKPMSSIDLERIH